MASESPGLEKYYEALREEFEDYDGELSEEVRRTPDLLNLLTNLLREDIPARERRLINAAIGYVIAPKDIIPEEVFGSKAYIDDVFLCSHVLEDLIKNLGEEMIERNWEGEGEILSLIKELHKRTGESVGEKNKAILKYAGIE